MSEWGLLDMRGKRFAWAFPLSQPEDEGFLRELAERLGYKPESWRREDDVADRLGTAYDLPSWKGLIPVHEALFYDVAWASFRRAIGMRLMRRRPGEMPVYDLPAKWKDDKKLRKLIDQLEREGY